MKLHSCYFPWNRIQQNNTTVQPNSCFLNKKKRATRVLWWNKDREKRSRVGVVTSAFCCTSNSPAGDGTAAAKSPGSELWIFGIFGIYGTCMLVMKTSTEPPLGVRTQAGMCVCTQRTEACECRSASRCSLAWTSAYKLCTCVKRVWRSWDLFFFFSYSEPKVRRGNLSCCKILDSCLLKMRKFGMFSSQLLILQGVCPCGNLSTL